MPRAATRRNGASAASEIQAGTRRAEQQVAAMHDDICVTAMRDLERPFEVLEEVVAAAAANDARTARPVEADVGVGDEEHAHVTPS